MDNWNHFALKGFDRYIKYPVKPFDAGFNITFITAIQKLSNDNSCDDDYNKLLGI